MDLRGQPVAVQEMVMLQVPAAHTVQMGFVPAAHVPGAPIIPLPPAGAASSAVAPAGAVFACAEPHRFLHTFPPTQNQIIREREEMAERLRIQQQQRAEAERLQAEAEREKAQAVAQACAEQEAWEEHRQGLLQHNLDAIARRWQRQRPARPSSCGCKGYGQRFMIISDQLL